MLIYDKIYVKTYDLFQIDGNKLNFITILNKQTINQTNSKIINIHSNNKRMGCNYINP